MNAPVAVVPVAGVGTRLRPHTYTTPKALLNVAGKAMVSHIVDDLVAVGVSELVLVVGYLGDRVRTYIDRRYPDLTVHYVEQAERKGLGHALHLTRDAVAGRNAVIVLGDTISKVDFAAVLRSPVTRIGVKEVDDPRRFGVAVMQGDRIERFVEKPEQPISRLAIVGIYHVTDSPALYRALDALVQGGKTVRGEYQLTDALQDMLESGVPMETFPVEAWYDCGKPETWLETNRVLLDLEAEPREIEGSVILPPVAVDPTAVVTNSVVGPHTTLGAGVVVEDAVIRNSIVGERSRVTRTLLDASLIGEDVVVEGAFRQLDIGDSSRTRSE